MRFKVVVSKSAEKSLNKFSEPLLSRLLKAIVSLEANPRPPGCKKLKGSDETLWRIRVGDYRIIYHIEDRIFIVDIREVGHRGSIY
ncbi:MAG: type II toxin-antitoxin system RelE/ParE family toxin [Cyclobacteriaceae bacterium]|nr:type II toxin-antitoxin system RelE/ParE family toxin [Cyclobacteriaceae bacterium]